MPPENGMTRREELLAVATKLFAARGYHGTRMDDVADVVGLNKATVYRLLAELQASTAGSWASRLQPFLSTGAPQSAH